MHALKNLFYVLTDNIEYFGIYFLLFIAVFALVYITVVFFSGGKDVTQSRLLRLVGKEKTKQKEDTDKPKLIKQDDQGLASKLSKPLHRLSSLEKRTARQRLLLKLVRAGYRSDKAVNNYLALKIILPIVFISIYLLSRIYYSFASEMIAGVIILALMGFYTPTVWVWLMTLARKERIFKGLPDALDLMVVCVESGLGLDMTFKRVGDEMKGLCKDLADEFYLTTLEIRAGLQRDEAFRNMSLRTDSPEVRNLMTVLIQTSRFGTSLAKALRIHADGMRIKRRQIAEETAAKSTVKLIFPLVLCIFPAIFVVLIGPGAIQIIKHLFPVLGN